MLKVITGLFSIALYVVGNIVILTWVINSTKSFPYGILTALCVTAQIALNYVAIRGFNKNNTEQQN